MGNRHGDDNDRDGRVFFCIGRRHLHLLCSATAHTNRPSADGGSVGATSHTDFVSLGRAELSREGVYSE